MYVLGVNAFPHRGHDASACLLRDGRLLHFVEEERLSRNRHAWHEMPFRSIGYCLEAEGIGLDDVDVIANGWDVRSLLKFAAPRITDEQAVNWLLPHTRFSYAKPPNLVHIPHHVAHAASAYFASGWTEASVLVVDGQGEEESVTLAAARDGKIEILEQVPLKDSLGYFYAGVSEYVGLGKMDGGKLMGLAAYGQPMYSFDNDFRTAGDSYTTSLQQINFKSKYDWDAQVIEQWTAKLENRFGRRGGRKTVPIRGMGLQLDTKEFTRVERNLAASAQAQLEELVTRLAGSLIRRTGIRRLALAGGVALNCVANGKLLERGIADELYLFPATNDGGVAVGAAFEAYYRATGSFVPFPVTHPYWGPGYTDDEIRETLACTGLPCEYTEEPWEKAAELLSQGLIVGWFQGKAEAGPRALGNRSILANPADPEMLRRVNEAKFREGWRPFAPSLLFEHYRDVLECPAESPFMLLSSLVKAEWRKRIPAVVHVDGTTRPQTVRRETNELYWKLLTAFYRRTGIPLVLNTSFNIKGEPIVCSPIDAIRSFYSSGLDALILQNAVILKLDSGGDKGRNR